MLLQNQQLLNLTWQFCQTLMINCVASRSSAAQNFDVAILSEIILGCCASRFSAALNSVVAILSEIILGCYASRISAALNSVVAILSWLSSAKCRFCIFRWPPYCNILCYSVLRNGIRLSSSVLNHTWKQWRSCFLLKSISSSTRGSDISGNSSHDR